LNEDIESALQDYFDKNPTTHPGKRDVKIQNITALKAGWESIIFAFDLVHSPQFDRQPERLILRIYPGEDAYEKSIREFKGMQNLFRMGYPIPAVYTLERAKSPFGKPFIIMEYIEGETIWPILDRSTPEDATALLTRFCELFIQLHGLDWHSFVFNRDQPAAGDPYQFVDRYLKMLRSMSESFPVLKAFLPTIEWLEARRDEVPCIRPALIHWDFHPGNLILQPDSAIKVIDWTQIQVSDPRFDLGWTLLLVGAYSGSDAREFILEEYQRLYDAEVENLAFFDVANAIKRLGSVMISISAGAEKMGMRNDAIASMRRDFPALHWVYNLMVERTEIKVAEIERFLDS